ncbi:hypothetical protein, partial [Haladaptatus sp. NG-SE-30]
PYTLTYEETDPEKPYIIVGLIDGHMLDIDVDIGDDHEVTFEGDINEIRTLNGALAFTSASGGPHTILKFKRDHDGISGVDGVDIQGDLSAGLGVVTSPFHHPEYDLTAEPTEHVYFDDVVEHEEASLNKGFGVDLLEHESEPEPERDPAAEHEEFNAQDYTPSATTTDETTDDIRDIFAALDRLDARRVADRTIVHSWNDNAGTSDGNRAFVPTWGPGANGTANIVNSEIWQDTGSKGGYGGPVVMALIAAGDIQPGEATPRVSGEKWWTGIERLRELGFDVPKYESPDSQPVSALPLGQLDALSHDDRKRAARKRGLEWPSTDDARTRLFDTITEVMGHQDTAVVDAPTSIGKSYTVATTPWSASQYDAVTAGRQVVHLSATRDARDENIEAANENGVSFFVLRARDEACPIAAGDYDPDEDDDNDRLELTVNGTPASEWIRTQCDGKGIAFSAAHRRLEDVNDQHVDDLPCCEDDGTCPAIRQWEELRTIRQSETDDLDVVFGTHEFAHVPGLRMQTNIVVDEEPDYTQSLSKDRVARAITAFLKEIDAPVQSWEAFIQLARNDAYGTDAATERDALEHKLSTDPAREWYFDEADAHTLAPGLARAIFNGEDRTNGRWFGKTVHEPPRLDATVRDEEGWNREWLSVTMTADNQLRTVRSTPDFSQARSVVGLDAHPARPKWMVNVHPAIQTKAVLDSDERRLWRRYERGLRVVQVGDATRPLSGDNAREWLDDDGVRTFFDHLVNEYGAETARTAITTTQVESRVGELMSEAGCYQPDTMHYGEEKSRNDYKHERVGAVLGCMDPGDDHVVDLLAELDLEAQAQRSDTECQHCDGDGCHKCDGTGHNRAHGRGFVGEDADTAQEVLASVRESHVAQAAGRYARNPDDPDSHATVFVRTDAIPPGFADVKVPGVEWVFTETQREIIETLRDARGTMTAQEIADDVACSREHVRQTLKRHHEHGTVQTFDGHGANGATLYADSGCPNTGYVDLGETSNDAVWEANTWALEISDVGSALNADSPTGGASTPSQPATTGEWDWESGPGDG